MDVQITIKNYRCFPESKPASIILRKGMTAIVGTNNSGKSSLLKFFYELRNLFQVLSNHNGMTSALNPNRASFQLAREVKDQTEIFSNVTSGDIEIHIKVLDDVNDIEIKNTHGLYKPNEIFITIPRDTNKVKVELVEEKGKRVTAPEPSFKDGTALFSKTRPFMELTPLFQLFTEMANTLYIGPFRNAINIGTKEEYYDIQIGEAFISQWKDFVDGYQKNMNDAATSITEDIKHIFGFTKLRINASSDGHNLKIYINDKSYLLSEIGSGLTHFILVLANAEIKNVSYILIDEPELNLHPRLQSDFLTTLATRAKLGTMYCTHSMGLARTVSERIFLVRSTDEEGKSEVAEFGSHPRLSEFLGELSFSGYRELGYTKVLLVEGVTDVLTMQQFLRLHKKDHEIVILPMGGGALINKEREAELGEILRLSEEIYVIIDSEKKSKTEKIGKEREEFELLCNKLDITCLVLDRRATENYLTENAIQKVKGPKYSSLGNYNKLSDVSPRWGKVENWKIAREMKISDIQSTDLGKFIARMCKS